MRVSDTTDIESFVGKIISAHLFLFEEKVSGSRFEDYRKFELKTEKLIIAFHCKTFVEAHHRFA